MAIVLANCTDRLQPLDVKLTKTSSEGIYKTGMLIKYAYKFRDNRIKKSSQLNLLTLMNTVKPLAIRWIVNLFEYLSTKLEIIKSGFRVSRIGQCPIRTVVGIYIYINNY